MKVQFIQDICLSLWKVGETFEDGMNDVMFRYFKCNDFLTKDIPVYTMDLNLNKHYIFIPEYCKKAKQKFIEAGVYIEGIGFNIPKGIYDITQENSLWKWDINGIKIEMQNMLIPHPLCDGEGQYEPFLRILDMTKEEEYLIRKYGSKHTIDEQYFSKTDLLKIYIEEKLKETGNNCYKDILDKMKKLNIK